MATPSYTISAEAYYKIFFHTAKHPHQPVNGVLLGTQERSGKSGTAHGPVTIADAVPLLHHWTSLSPMMEIGLDLVRSLSSALCCCDEVNVLWISFIGSFSLAYYFHVLSLRASSPCSLFFISAALGFGPSSMLRLQYE
jgi:hypothetical protein